MQIVKEETVTFKNNIQNELNKINIINPIETLSQKENEEVIKDVLKSVKDMNNTDKWISWEESKSQLIELITSEAV